MKQMKTLLQQLRHCCKLKGRKVGSSLGMVMIVGTALVIWVMAIMPLMTTTGTTALKTQSTQDDYLTARSSIEFSKSELEKIVETQIPYTFAVLQDDSGKFSALPKKDGIITSTAYQACVEADATDDTKDVPKAGAAGEDVVAICAAKLNPSDTTQYLLTITTFDKGEKNLSYTAIYTLNGSLLIYPESYKQSQALPLSDFVLVDGKLGANDVWTSTIESPSDTSYTETMLPWLMEPTGTYANSAEYPAVFKMVAEAAVSGEGVAPAINEDPLTDQKWIMPTASSAEASIEGGMWVNINTSTGYAAIYMRMNGEAINVTDKCTVYFNGTVGLVGSDGKTVALPGNTGSYTIAVDYVGSGIYNKEAGAVNVLPINGLTLGNFTVPEGTRSMSNCKITNITYYENGNFVSVTMTPITGAKYGYTTKTDGTGVVWGDSNTITYLDASNTYYFYCYCPAGFVDGVYYRALEGVYVGMIYPFSAVSSVEDGGRYMIVRENQEQDHGYSWYEYYAVQGSESLGVTKWNENTQYKGRLGKGVMVAEADSNAVWTVLNKKNSNGNYSSTWRITKGTINSSGVYEAQKYLGVSNSYGANLSTSTDKADLNIDFSGSVATIKRNSLYLRIRTNKCETTSDVSKAKLYLIKVPVAGATTVEAPITTNDQNYTFEFAYDSTMNNSYSLIQQVFSLSNKTINPYPIYANGVALGDGDKLNAGGTYSLVGGVSNESASGYVVLGTAKVTKATLPADLAIKEITRDTADELKVTVEGENWHTNGGIRYFGYKLSDAAEFNWFASTENSFTFRLDYGKYIFAIAESGTINYSAGSLVQSEEIDISASPVEIAPEEASMFKFSLNGDYKATWYGLPQKADGSWKILPSRITLVYGTPIGESGISWSYSYSEGVRFYGVLIKGSEVYNSLDSVLQISQPIGVTNVNGHFSSMMRGSSLYFMGTSASINTYGNDVYLTTDMLVLGRPTTGGGRVIVNPYSTGEDDPGDTLVFFVSAMGNFKAKNFYCVPAGTDLNNVSASSAAAWLCHDGDGIGTDSDNNFATAVKYLFRHKIYPEVNLDIAYASEEQLASITSGETIQWTSDGELKGSSPTSNTKYVVCAYVSDVSAASNISYRANRVLIAAKDTSGTYTMSVPKNVTFWTRYFSIDADNLVQENSGVTFVLKNLAQDPTFVSQISSALGISNYSSKTLQADFERYTYIDSTSGRFGLEPQICRYDDGTDLFANGMNNQELLVTYTTQEIQNLFNTGAAGWASSSVKTVDRYIQIVSDSGEMNVGAAFKCTLDMYANYIYIAPSVNKITVSSLLDSSLRVNSQESGYTTDYEYLYLFKKHSAESYSGTLLYFAEPVEIQRIYRLFGWEYVDSHTVQKGFYYIAASDNGVSLTDLASNASAYKVDETILKNYSVYIDPETGSLSNAYVDTGIYDSESAGLGGFSGGSMK